MLIRSQDKKIIVDMKANTIRISNMPNTDDGISDFQIIVYGNNQSADIFETLGRYSSEEKALKVLDIIQDYYMNAINSRCRVFQMPQDSEVEV